MEQYLIDTNAISHYLSESLPAAGMDFIDGIIDSIPNISVISQIELLSWQSAKSSQITDFVNDSVIFNISPEVVQACVKIRKTKKIKTPDAIIAATALVNGFILITDNEKDFINIPKLKIINPNRF